MAETDMWKPGYTATGRQRFGVGYQPKYYRGTFRVRSMIRFTRKVFKTASSAEKHALEVMCRYRRLLEAMAAGSRPA